MTLLAWDNKRKVLTFDNVSAIDVHEGTWQLYDIYSGELNLTIMNHTITWKSHIELTGNHPLLVYRNATESWEKLNATAIYQLWCKGESLYISHLWYNYTLKPFPITNITTRTFKGKVYNLHASKPNIYFFGKTFNKEEQQAIEIIKEFINEFGKQPPFLFISSKTTYYVDWLPVKIVYTLPEQQKSWHTVETWNFTLLTRTWHNVESWTFNIVTRAWHTVESWFFKIIGREWHNIESWQFNIKTRQWQTIEVWNFNLTVLKSIPPLTPIPSKVISKTKPEYIATTYIVVGMILCLVYAYFRKTSKG